MAPDGQGDYRLARRRADEIGKAHGICAQYTQGVHHLFRLSSRSYAEGWLVKWPRMDKEIIASHAAGLMASTGCPSGELQTRLRLGQFDEALKGAAEWRDIFGKENYFLELMEHGLDIERRVRDGLLEVGKKLGIRAGDP